MSSIGKTDFSVSRGALSATGPSIGEVFTNFSKDLADRERAEKLQAQQDLLFQMKIDEAKRVEQERQALKDYTFNPADALAKQRADADTALINRYDVLNKQADDAITKAGYNPKTAANVLGSEGYDALLAKAGVANPALSEAQARGISNVYEQATPFKEDVAATVYTDLVKQGVDDKAALNRAAGVANSYESLADLQKREDDKTKLLNEASKQDFDRAIKMMDLIRKDQKDADGSSAKGSSGRSKLIDELGKLGNSTEEKTQSVRNLRNLGATDSQIAALLKFQRENDEDILDFSHFGIGKPDAALSNKSIDKIAEIVGITREQLDAQKKFSPDIDVREQVLKAGQQYKTYSPSDIRADRSKVLGGNMADKLDDIFGKAKPVTETKVTGKESKVIEEKSKGTVVDPDTVKTYDPKVDTDTATKISTAKDLNIVGANPTGIKDYSKRPKMTNVTGGVIHRTGGGDRDPKSMENDSYITSGKGDAHYYINSDGTIVSLIPENVKAYHSGDNRNANNIGIEVAGFHSSQFTKGDKNYNPSIEKAVIKKYGKLPDWSSTGGWEPMTKAQEAATLKLTGNLNEKYGLSYDKYSAHLKNGTEGADVLKFLQGSGKNGNAKKMTSNEIIEEYGKATDKDLSGVWTGMPDYNEGRYSKVAGKVDSTLFGDHITTRNISKVANQLRKDGFNTTEQISNLLSTMPEGMDKKLVTARLNEKMAQENTLVPFEPGMVNGLIKEFVLDKKDITYKDGKVYIPYNTLKKIDAVKDATLLAAATIASATPVGAGFKVATKFKPTSSALHLTPVGTVGKEASKKAAKKIALNAKESIGSRIDRYTQVFDDVSAKIEKLSKIKRPTKAQKIELDALRRDRIKLRDELKRDKDRFAKINESPVRYGTDYTGPKIEWPR